MRSKFLIVIFLTSILFSSKSLCSQDTLKVNLKKALEIALSENPTIKLANKEIERQNYYKNEVKGGLLPTLSGSAQYNRNIDPQVIFMPPNIFGPGTGGPMKIGSDNSYSAGLTLSVPVFAAALYKMMDISETDLKIALEKSRASKLDMVSEVKKAYFTLLLAKKSYEVITLSLENAIKNLDRIKNFHRQGIVAEYDVIRSEVQVRNLNPAIVQAQNFVNISAMMLKILLGVGTDVELIAEGSLTDYEQDLIDFKPIYSVPLEENSNLKQLDLQQYKLSQQYQLLRTNRLPTLAAFGNFQYQSQANDFKFGDYDWVKTSMVGFQLQVPIFQGFTKKFREKQVLVGIDQLKLQRDYIGQNLTLQARNAITSMIRATEQVSTTKESIALAERGYSIAQTRYGTGTGTVHELNDAEDALRQAKFNYNQALFDFLKAKVDYETITAENDKLINSK